jgi:hypothetical protein
MVYFFTTNLLLAAMEKLNVLQKDSSRIICITYKCITDRALYDICDFDGRIIKSGTMNNLETEICVDGLPEGRYVVWVVDGEKVTKTHFQVK